jgi:hypothetical protein
VASGDTFGAAFRALALEQSAGPRRKSYRAKGWRAQLRQLQRTKAGRAAVSTLNVTPRTLTAWAGGKRAPTKANQGRIGKLYAFLAGGFPPQLKPARFEITGEVTIGADVRQRGSKGTAPLRLEGDGHPRQWTGIEQAWDAGEPDDVLEEAFIQGVVHADLDLSDFVRFSGTGYNVVTY